MGVITELTVSLVEVRHVDVV